MDLSIVIVHTHERDLLLQTLRGIRRADPALDYEIIVVDNSPADGLGALLRVEFPSIRYLPKSQNSGFGAGMNLGIKHALGRYTFIFNPDIIPRPGALEQLLAYLESHPQVGMVGPRLLNADLSLQDSIHRFPTLNIPVIRRSPLKNGSFGKRIIANYFLREYDHERLLYPDWIMGSAMFARTALLRGLKGFDERFFMYMEDADLCFRIWASGYQVVYLPSAVMVHYHRRASNDGSYFYQIFLSWYTHQHIKSAIKYYLKHRRDKNPRETIPYLKSLAPGEAN